MWKAKKKRHSQWIVFPCFIIEVLNEWNWILPTNTEGGSCQGFFEDERNLSKRFPFYLVIVFSPFFMTLEAFYSSMELSHLLTTCQMILPPSLIRVVFWGSEFQGKLTTPGNSVLTRCSCFFFFSPQFSDAFFSPLKHSGRGSVMFSAKYEFRKSHGCLGNFQYEGKMIGLKTKFVIHVQ